MSSPSIWYATRATGIVALVLLTASMVLGLGTAGRLKARRWPGFAQQELHRRISMISLVFVGLHVLTSVLDSFVSISWLALVVPFTSSYNRFWVAMGTVSLDLMLAVVVTSLLRHRMKPATWRAVHWMAYLSWPLALGHTFGMGTDAGEAWVIALAVACILAVVATGAWRLRVRVTPPRGARPEVLGHA